MFHPFLLKKNITEITVEELREMGVVGLLLDVDNTFTAHDSCRPPSLTGSKRS